MPDAAPAIRTMPEDLAAARAKLHKRTQPRRPRPASARPLFLMPTVSRRTTVGQLAINLPAGERREKAQTSAVALVLVLTTLVLGGLIALIIDLI